jgi:hypothetical protein
MRCFVETSFACAVACFSGRCAEDTREWTMAVICYVIRVWPGLLLVAIDLNLPHFLTLIRRLQKQTPDV